MLKKAGIVVAAAAATLLAVSPLAFAGDKGDDWGHHHGSDTANTNYSDGGSSEGLVNVSGNNVAFPINGLCNNDVPVAVAGIGAAVPVQKVAVPLTAALGILGDAQGGDSSNKVDDERNCSQGDTGAGDSVGQGIDD